MPDAPEFQEVLFLDTNYLHYARLFLEIASEKGLPPMGASTDNPDKVLEDLYPRKSRALEDLKKGQKVVNLLHAKSESGAQILFAPITRFELICGLLRGRAMINAAKEEVAFRMWSHIDEAELFDRLIQDDYTNVFDRTDSLEGLCKRAGIVLSQTDPKETVDIWKLAQRVLSLVYLEIADSLVYANALLAEADALVCDDKYLSWIINSIDNPGGSGDSESERHFLKVRTLLLQSLSGLIRTEASKINLPRAIKAT